MVSFRFIMMVKEELKKLGLKYVIVELGMVKILDDISEEQQKILEENHYCPTKLN
ncbi:MAG: hypothetical protein GTO44_08965 [Hydrotalea flava]|uniref:hypothetical protein n=1 Tax=Hydrotalea sp. TaxID=2881279 RepID=UPI0016A1D67B|nr:hypothetical protein [Hydrotalea sp.]NIN15196.1 hypothetical protein [Hydrotalea flava]